MKLISRARLVKYAVKSAILMHHPGLYWSARRVLKGHHEPELALLARFADASRIALDVGAHFGMWTYALARHFRACHAFEPIPRLAAVLRAGAGPRVHLHESAISNRTGRTTLRVPVAGLGRSTIEEQNRLDGLQDPTQSVVAIEVATVRLDDLGLGDVGFIKIDVEGHELEVLEGGWELITRSRPILVIELEERHRPGATAAVTDRLTSLGYVPHRVGASRNVVFLPPGVPAIRP